MPLKQSAISFKGKSNLLKISKNAGYEIMTLFYKMPLTFTSVPMDELTQEREFKTASEDK